MCTNWTKNCWSCHTQSKWWQQVGLVCMWIENSWRPKQQLSSGSCLGLTSGCQLRWEAQLAANCGGKMSQGKTQVQYPKAGTWYLCLGKCLQQHFESTTPPLPAACPTLPTLSFNMVTPSLGCKLYLILGMLDFIPWSIQKKVKAKQFF